MSNVKVLEEKKFDNIDEMVQFYYFTNLYEHIPYTSRTKLVENNEHLISSLDDFYKEVETFKSLYDNKIRNISRKLENHRCIRMTIKNIKNMSNTQISQSYTKNLILDTVNKTVSNIIERLFVFDMFDDIVKFVCDAYFENDLLKKEFELMILKITVQVSNKGMSASIIEPCFIDEIYSYYKDQDLEEHKKNIQILLNMSNTELREHYKHIVEKNKNKELAKSQLKEEIFNSVKSGMVNSLVEKGLIDNENYARDVVNHIIDNNLLFDKKSDNSLYMIPECIHIYRKSFLYDKDIDDKDINRDCLDYLLDMKEYMDDLSGDKIRTIDYFNQYVHLHCQEKLNEFDIPDDLYDEIVFLLSIDFTLYLSHSLLECVKEHKEKLVDLCLDMSKIHKNILEHYTMFEDLIKQQAVFVQYEPVHMYEVILLASVLLELHSSSHVFKTIKQFFMSHYKEYYQELDNINKNEHRVLFYLKDNEQEEFKSNTALTFLFNFIYKPHSHASISAFLFQFGILANIFMINYFKHDDVVRYINNEECETDYSKEYGYVKHIIDDLENHDLTDIEQEYVYKNYTSVRAVLGNHFYFINLKNYKDLLIQYHKHLSCFLKQYIAKKDIIDFESIDYKERLMLLLDALVTIYLTEKTFESNKFIPSVSDITKDHEIISLKEHINKQDETIKNLENTLEQYKLTINKQQETIKSNSLEINKINIKEHNKELSSLNKQLKEKDKEINDLKEDQQELHKLRELIFKLQSDDIENNDPIDDKIDYSSYILDISKNNKIVCIGGHIKLLQQLNKIYPEIVFIEKESQVNDNIINNADIVLFFHNFLSHTLYYKVMNILKNNRHINFDYIASRNLNRVEKEIYEKIVRYV